MAAYRHLALIFCYAVLSTAVAAYLPEWLPAAGRELALVVGAVVFLAGGLLHEIYCRMGRENYLGEQVLSLRQVSQTLHDELTWTQREMKIVREALEDTARRGLSDEFVLAEVKVLKSLLQRLSGASPAADPLAADPLARTAKAPMDRASPETPNMERDPPARTEQDRQPVLDAVRDALREDRVELALQPIVSLPQRKRRFYECFSRIRTRQGEVIFPEQYIEIARQADLIGAIDNLLLFRCIQLIRKIQRQSQNIGFFCNVSPHTLRDGEFLGDFIGFLEGNRELAPNLIFEFAQADFAEHGATETAHLDRLARLGCSFSLDRVRDFDIDPAQLAARHIRFVKIPAEALLAQAAGGALALKHKMVEAGIDLIVEKVERDDALVEILELGIDFGQGFLFGEPRPARPAD